MHSKMIHVARNSNTKKKISEIPSIFVRNNKFKRWADSVNKIDPVSIFSLLTPQLLRNTFAQ